MIIRIVKMTFREGSQEEFLEIFDGSSGFIRNFPGCKHLELLRDINDHRIFFTYSYWNTADDLENYRKSELFKGVWKKTSALFAEKAVAWSVDRLRRIDA